MLQKLLWSTILAITVGVLSGCKTEEPVVLPQLKPAVSLVRMVPPAPQPAKSKIDLKKKLEQILEEHKVEHIDSFYVYTPELKEELFQALRNKYDYKEEWISAYAKTLNSRQSLYGAVVMLPRARVGKGDSSLCCIFQGIAIYVKNDDDLISEIVDYAGHKAQDNAKGVTICGDKIDIQKINLITPSLYQDILELRARTYQAQQIIVHDRAVSDDFKIAFFVKYLSIVTHMGKFVSIFDTLEQKGQKLNERQAKVKEYLTDVLKWTYQTLETKDVERK